MSNSAAAYYYYTRSGHPVPPPIDLRKWKANICGIRVPGLPAVPGGAVNPDCLLSWFYHLYGPDDRTKCRAAMHARGYTHWVLSWTDVRRSGGTAQFLASLAQELQADGFAVCIMGASKYDLSDLNVQQVLANLLEVLPVFLAAGVRLFSIGWELNLWLSPAELRQYINAIAPVLVPKALLYVHFSAGYFAWQFNGQDTAAFWNASVGQLTGILYQKGLEWDDPLFQAIVADGLIRFAGGFNFVSDSGFGHPFDYITWEDTAELQYFDTCSEAEGDRIGRVGVNTPPMTGPTGITVSVMGFGNGCTR